MGGGVCVGEGVHGWWGWGVHGGGVCMGVGYAWGWVWVRVCMGGGVCMGVVCTSNNCWYMCFI